MGTFDTSLSVCIGIGLATACGLRVFIPLLMVSAASHFGHLPLSPGFQWLSSTPAMLAFSVTACIEVAGYYIPWVDNALDAIASPAAVVAGTIITVAVMKNMDPFYRWALGIIAGGGMAGLVQGTTVLARGASSAGTGGLANPLIATVEWMGSIVVSTLAMIVPLLLVAMVAAVFCVLAFWVLRRRSARRAVS